MNGRTTYTVRTDWEWETQGEQKIGERTPETTSYQSTTGTETNYTEEQEHRRTQTQQIIN